MWIRCQIARLCAARLTGSDDRASPPPALATRSLRQVRRQREPRLPRGRHPGRRKDHVRARLRPVGTGRRTAQGRRRRAHHPPQDAVGTQRAPHGAAPRSQLVTRRRHRQGRARHRHHLSAGVEPRYREEVERPQPRRVRGARRSAPRRRRTGVGRRRAHGLPPRAPTPVPQRHTVPQRHGQHSVRPLRGDRGRR